MTTPKDLAKIADDIEAAAFRDMYAGAPPDLNSHLGLRYALEGSATVLMAEGIPDPVFDRAIGLGNDGRADILLIDAIMLDYANAHIGQFWIHVNPVLAPRELGAVLESKGFTFPKRRSWAKMVREANRQPEVETPLTVREALPHERVATSSAIAAAFGMPPPFARWIESLVSRPSWTMMTAIDIGGQRIAGGGLLFVEGEFAWLGLGGVLPDARRRNAHRAIMAARVSYAMERGCKYVVTETGEPINNEPNPSLRNMYRLGFERVASRLNYASPLLLP